MMTRRRMTKMTRVTPAPRRRYFIFTSLAHGVFSLCISFSEWWCCSSISMSENKIKMSLSNNYPVIPTFPPLPTALPPDLEPTPLSPVLVIISHLVSGIHHWTMTSSLLGSLTLTESFLATICWDRMKLFCMGFIISHGIAYFSWDLCLAWDWIKSNWRCPITR